jgi:high affinity sulfate transporter 1
MNQIEAVTSRPWRQHLARVAPGLAKLLAYNRSDFPNDLVAGLSVSAVALPVGVAYAQLAGFNPEVGLYASILPLVAYVIFGTSRQLIIGPDAAVCALVAAAVGPMAAGDSNLYMSLTESLTLIAGVICIAASFLRLGGIADFLSKPILAGFLNGVALSIILGQISKVFGFPISSGGILPRLFEFLSKLGETHWPTLAVGLVAFTILALSPRVLPRVPAALVAMIATGAVMVVPGLRAMGIKTIGPVPAGLPSVHMPQFSFEVLPDLTSEAFGLALISFSSMMLTARSFASKNRYEIDIDRELIALGAANIAAAISRGFAVSGADSRTAVNDDSGGRTQLTSLVAACVVAVVLMFFTRPLEFVPIAALGAVLVKAALTLVDFGTLRTLYRIDRREFALSILATVGVVAVGPIKAILVAVILAIIRFVRLVSSPRVEILGSVKDLPGLHPLARYESASTIPGLLLFRFNAPIVFFNAPCFKREALAAADAAGSGLKWFVIDMIPITIIDATGLYAAADVINALASRGIAFATAGRQTEWVEWGKNNPHLLDGSGVLRFPTLRSAVKAYRRQHGPLELHNTKGGTQSLAG